MTYRRTRPALAVGVLMILSLTAIGVFVAADAKKYSKQRQIARGKYMVIAGGCNDCHTPLKMGANGPEPDMTKMLSGHPEALKIPPVPKLPPGPWISIGAGKHTAFAGPWGVTYAINLTPDENTGIGIWTKDIFVKALRSGKHMGVSRPIQPPMPWHHYRQLSDADLGSLYAYLRSIPPISNRVPEYEPPVVSAGR